MMKQKNGHADLIRRRKVLVPVKCNDGHRSRNCHSLTQSTQRLRNIPRMRKVTTDRCSTITSADSVMSATVPITEPERICRERKFAVSIAEHKIAVPSRLFSTRPAQIAAARGCPVKSANSKPAISTTAKAAVVKRERDRIGGPSAEFAATARAV